MSFKEINVLIPVNDGVSISVESGRFAQNVRNSLNTFEVEQLLLQIDSAMGNAELTACVIRGLLDSLDSEVQNGDRAEYKELKEKISKILHRC